MFVCVFIKNPKKIMKPPKLTVVLELLRPPEDLLSFVTAGLWGGCNIAGDLRIPELVLRVSPCVLGIAVRNQGPYLEK